VDRETGTEQTPAGQPAPVRASGNLPAHTRPIIAGLAADPRVPVWIRRAIMAAVVAVVISIFGNWRWGLTAAAAVAIVDTIYQSKNMGLIPAAARVTSAQRKTRRRLYLLRPNGYLAVNARAIPGTDSVIDHLVIGPGGVFAVDSERWDRRLPIRTVAGNSAAGPVLYHGPFSQKDRLAHARWEAAQASRLLSADLGREIQVSPAMVVYGPMIPWTVATLRGVDVFAGRAVGKYFRGRSKAARSGRSASRLTWEEAGEIFNSAQRTLPLA
jgi:hypothetical protein